MATYKTPDFGKYFMEKINEKLREEKSDTIDKVDEVGTNQTEDIIESSVTDDVASTYQEGDGDATYGDLVELIGVLDEEDYNEIADCLLDFMDEKYGDLDDEDMEFDDEDMEEAVDAFVETLIISEENPDNLTEDELIEIAKRFKNFNKSRTFFTKTASKMKVDRLKNRTVNRIKRIKGRVQRKRTRFARKKYQKSRNQAIKIGKHIVKKHRGLK